MGLKQFLVFFFVMLFAFGWAQEEESAELTYEGESDAFQETFFEGLKQKGIENYSRAIDLFLQCKQFRPDDKVIDHELAKAYLKNKDYVLAKQYAQETLESDLANKWFLKTYVEVLQKQMGTPDVEEYIQYEDKNLKYNLAEIFYRQGHHQGAMKILNSIKSNTAVVALMGNVEDALNTNTSEQNKNQINQSAEQNPMVEIQGRLEHLMDQNNFQKLEQESQSALEMYPAQPILYYFLGMAEVGLKQIEKGANTFEMGLDMVFDDPQTEQLFLKALFDIHTLLGNTSKANMYLSKIKSGS
jgi:tetratricopeptide (TPR) repeat protein